MSPKLHPGLVDSTTALDSLCQGLAMRPVNKFFLIYFADHVQRTPTLVKNLKYVPLVLLKVLLCMVVSVSSLKIFKSLYFFSRCCFC